MAYTKLVFENPNTGHIKEAPVGFSWTMLFFSFFPPLFRSDWKWAVITFLLTTITWGLSNLVFMFIYNKLYIKDLVGSGFKAKSVKLGTIDEISKKLEINLPLLETA
ncbi:MAG: hypothetical protein A6F72_01895 [Cycloclasticus sp. symbiont of Poecilosclerida sp. N]|nr:MAG: hypothetical protein A6F72_01895 [Cycloclasticus sp. symbiont of Poecilosclerida sp. N]